MNGRLHKLPAAIISIALLFGSVAAQAETAEEKGLAIAKEANKRTKNFGDYKADMEMILKNRNGDVSTRYIRIMGLEVANDGDKSLSIFDEPADVKGTAMLTYSHKTESDDQWLYLPALKRVKRISSRNKSGPFMGSEFAYEDIGSQEVEKYTYKYVRDEVFDGVDCFVNERDPVDKYSGYTRQLVWLSKDNYLPLKIEFYDRKNALLKTLVSKGYKNYLNDHWRASDMFMDNHQTGKSTRILWKNFEFGTGLTDKDFEVNDLKRRR